VVAEGAEGQITYIYSSNPSKVARGINSWLCLATRCETWRFSGRVGSTQPFAENRRG
jgi:hypothetical protein